MGLIERFFRRRSVDRPIVPPMPEGVMNAGDRIATSRRNESLRDALAFDVSLITPDMPYEEALRRLTALDQLNSEPPPVRIKK